MPTDIFVTDVAELEARKDVNGSMHYWPSREGQVVYARVTLPNVAASASTLGGTSSPPEAGMESQRPGTS